MNILFVAKSLSYGGAPRRFVDLANGMANRGMNITLMVYNGENQLRDKINKNINSIERQEEEDASGWIRRNIYHRMTDIKYINEFLKNHKFDIIISFNDMVNLSILLSKEAKKSVVIISERSDPNYNRKSLQIIKKILFRKADGIVFQTVGAQKFFGKKIQKASTVIPNPIPSDMSFNRYTGEKEKIIVSVARLWIYQKRQDILITAFKDVLTSHPDYKLVLYGDGPDKEQIKELIIRSGLESKVELGGVTNNVFDSIKKASLFVLSSDFEGIPNSIIEAMAVGLPVVSTDCSPGGAALLIENDKNGLIVPRSNSKELSNAINYMLDNPDRAAEMGLTATNVINILNENNIYNKWEEYLRSFVK